MTALEKSWGGEIFVPEIPSYKILDLVEAIAPKCKIESIGVRPGEKINEEMITSDDSYRTFKCGAYYTINPSTPVWDEAAWTKQYKAQKVKPGFNYNSGTNSNFLTVQQIRELVKTQLDADFRVDM